MPEISIIVPVYNVESYLNRCIDSVLNQKYDNFELILVDDGSPDNCGKICDEYAARDKRVVVIHKQNEGVSAARNVGIEKAHGDYVTFVDSDDYVESVYLESLIKAISVNKQFAICGICYNNESCEAKTPQRFIDCQSVMLKKENEKVLADLISYRWFNYVYGKMYCRDILERGKIRFDVNISLGEDTVFVMDYLRHVDSVEILNELNYNYIQYPSGTLTRRFYEDIYDKYTYINNYILQTMKCLGVYDDSIQEAIDQRQLASFEWGVSSVRNATIEKKKKIEILNNILNTNELQDALKRHSELVQKRKDYKLVQRKSGSRLLSYYRCEDIKARMIRRIKIIVVAVVPSKIIKKVKSWL